MAFEHTKIPGLTFDLPASTTSDGRWYTTPEGKKYPSASTISGLLNRDVIAKWRAKVGGEEADRKTKRGADRGTYIHAICEKYLLNTMTLRENLGMMPTMKELYLQLKKEFDIHITKVYAVEQALYSDRLRIAGRTDAVVMWDGEIVILDVKTSGYIKPKEWIINYFVQASAYAEMFEERTGIAIKKVVIATAVEDTGYPSVYMEDKAEYLPILDKCLAEYYKEV
jgi:genome maintenance exonuclease 1